MSEHIGENRDHVVKAQTVTTYLVDYRISSRGDNAKLGDRQKRYKALTDVLELMAGSEYTNFEDLGHASTSSWIINTHKSAERVYRELIALLNPAHDVLAVFAVDLDRSWSTKNEGGDRVQS